MRTRELARVFVGLAFLALGCNGNTAPSAQANLGAAGGTVAASNGNAIQVPAGALTANTTLTMQPATTAPAPASASVVGTPYVLGPEGQQFAVPVMVTLAFDPAQLPAGATASNVVILTAPLGSNTFSTLATTLADSTHVQAATTHFSVFVPSVLILPDGGVANNLDGGASPIGGNTGSNATSGRGSGGTGGGTGSSPDAGFIGSTNTTGGPGGLASTGGGSGGSNDGGFIGSTNTTGGATGGPGTGTGTGGACAVCLSSLCAASCPAGMNDCSGVCSDPQSDPSNCGGCGAVCPSGETCGAGQCVEECGLKSGAGCGLSSGPDGGFVCGNPCLQCGGSCADVSSDLNNCGACGNVCSAGQICQSGACQPMCANGAVCANGACLAACPTGEVSCSGGCVDSQSDSQNCGGCGNVCPEGEACAAGTCATACGGSGVPNGFGCGASSSPDGGFTCGEPCGACNGGCADFTSDANNCGACGNVCPAGQLCQNSVCSPPCATGLFCAAPACVPSCPAGTSVCGTNCAQTQTDPSNCGACGAICPSGQGCFNGACTPYCGFASGPDAGGGFADGGFGGTGGTSGGGTGGTGGNCPGTLCGQQCTDLNGDPNNCGVCGKQCSAGVPCVAGECTGAPGDGGGPPPPDGGAGCPGTMCGQQCTDLQGDPNNCGACGVVCDAGFQCLSGACTGGASDGGASCPGTMCGQQCTDLQGDPNNCGACGVVCDAGFQCLAGACTASGGSDGGSCPTGERLCTDGCSTLQNDNNNCGACGHVCTNGTVCVGLQCAPPGFGDGG